MCPNELVALLFQSHGLTRGDHLPWFLVARGGGRCFGLMNGIPNIFQIHYFWFRVIITFFLIIIVVIIIIIIIVIVVIHILIIVGVHGIIGGAIVMFLCCCRGCLTATATRRGGGTTTGIGRRRRRRVVGWIGRWTFTRWVSGGGGRLCRRHWDRAGSVG